MPNRIDWPPILERLEGSLSALSELRRHLGLTTVGPWPPPIANAIHVAYGGYRLSHYRSLLAEGGIWEDRAIGKSFSAADVAARNDPRKWAQAFPDFTDALTNQIGNENYLVFEHHVAGTHLGPLQVDGRSYEPTRRKIEMLIADVMKIENGKAVRIHHYHDMVSLLRQLGLMPDIPIGHDEAPVSPRALHPTDVFARTRPSISIGNSKSPAARVNIATATAIHEAFVKRTPERFQELIAEDAIWIDVPTGVTLSGREAAVRHDYSNWAQAFPDSTAEVVNLIANEDWAVVEHIGTGTHSSNLRLGGRVYPPTRRRVEIRVLDIVQFRNGKAILIRNYYDVATMLFQLGVIPGHD